MGTRTAPTCPSALASAGSPCIAITPCPSHTNGLLSLQLLPECLQLLAVRLKRLLDVRRIPPRGALPQHPHVRLDAVAVRVDVGDGGVDLRAGQPEPFGDLVAGAALSTMTI